MKNSLLYENTIPVLLVSILLALSLGGLPLFAGEPGSDQGQRSCCSKVEPAVAFTDKSIYQVESKWTTDTGKQIKLATLKGKPQVVAMFFANCQYACPLIVNDLRRIEAALTPEQREQVGFTLVSFDSKRDTVEALAEYRRVRELPADRWTLLRGEPDDVLELAALLGVRYKQDASGQFAHSNLITVLNAEGEIAHQLVGLNQDVEETVKTLGKLLGETSNSKVQTSKNERRTPTSDLGPRTGTD